MPYLQPLRQNNSRRAVSKVVFLPAPSEGWNATDDLSNMAERDAIVLDNVIPTDGGVRTRPGYVEHATGLNGPVQSLMEYYPPAGSVQQFAATSDSIYDVSSAGTVGAADLSGLSNGWWQHVMFATTGGTYLVCCNGADGLRTYDGTNWADQTGSITNVNANDFISVISHLGRLWAIEAETLDAWYLPVGQINGAAAKIALGSFSRLGGKLMAIATWTKDGGEGTDDYVVFITNRGECHIYAGTDPSSVSTWARVGSFRIAEPVGYRCIIRAGSDIGVVTSQGIIALSTVLNMALSGQREMAATDRIGSAFQDSYSDGRSLNGWQIVEHPSERLVIVNIPLVEDTSSVQYVMNPANKGRWCRFTGLNANVFGLRDTEMYFGTFDGRVCRMTGSDDDGEAIDWMVIQAFNEFKDPRRKRFVRIKPVFFGPQGYTPRVGLRLDYDETVVDYPATASAAVGPTWDEVDWDVESWGGGAAPAFDWQGVRGLGFSAAVIVTGATRETVTYNGSKIAFEVGNDF